MKNKYGVLVLWILIVFLSINYSAKAESACPFEQEMSLGTENIQVGILQTFMKNTIKIYDGPITSYFGPITSASVKIFQKNSSLLETGQVDLVTANALCKVYLSYKTSEPVNLASDSCFLKTLGIKRGYFELENEEVKGLQSFLNQKGFYPENVISGFFGVKTESALKAFQKASKINESGIIDDVTFKAICGYESNQSLYCPFVTNNLSIGYFEEATNEVKTLQLILAKLGILEEKYVTGYFGNLTSEAVKTMQTKGGITATGVLDMATRQALCKALNLPMKDESNANPYESSMSKVDVAISDLNIFPTGKIDVNTRTSIVVKIKNIGSEESKPMISSLYINDQEINKANINAIKPNDEVMAITQNWVCPAKGIYALKIFVDSSNNLVETVKANNVVVVPLNCGGVDQKDHKYVCNQTTLKCEINDKDGKMLLNECEKDCVDIKDLPDLIVEKFEADKSMLKPNEIAKITIVEKNIGKSKADYHEVNFEINGKENKANWKPLEPGSSATFDQATFTCDTPGVFNINMTVDSNNSIKELNENNNSSKLVIKCADEKGNVPTSNQDGGQTGARSNGSSAKNPYGDGSGNGETENTPPSSNPTAIVTSKGTGGVCKTTNNLNVGAKYCTSFSGREYPPLVLPNGVSYFQLFPLDNINCVSKLNNITGRCDCCQYYRASPHKADIVLGGFYCEQEGSNCAIDFGDGTAVEQWTKKDRNYINDGGDNTSTWQTKKTHYYEVPEGKDYAIFCPKLIVGGKYYELSNQFVNDYEDKEKCIIVFRPNFVPPPYNGVVAPWEKYAPGEAKCPSQVNFAGNEFSAKVEGNKVKLYWALSVQGGESYLKKCPAVCVVEWGDGFNEQVLPCPLINNLEHTYQAAGNYTVRVKLNGFYDQDPNSTCIKREQIVLVKTGDSAPEDPAEPPKENPDDPQDPGNSEIPTDKNDIQLSCDLKDTARPIKDAVSVKMTATIKNSTACSDFLFKWGSYANTGWASGKSQLSDYIELSFYDENNSYITVDHQVQAICKNNKNVYGTARCTATFEKESPAKLDANMNNWLNNIVNNIFNFNTKSDEQNKITTTNLFNEFNINKLDTTINNFSNNNLNFIGNSLNSGNLNVAIARYEYDIVLNKCVPKANGIYTDLDKCYTDSQKYNFMSDANFNFSDLEFDSSNFGASQNFQMSDTYYSPYTSSSLETLISPTSKTGIAKIFKCDNATGYCSDKASLTSKEYSSEVECNKYCYKTSTINTNEPAIQNSNYDYSNFQFNQ